MFAFLAGLVFGYTVATGPHVWWAEGALLLLGFVLLLAHYYLYRKARGELGG